MRTIKRLAPLFALLLTAAVLVSLAGCKKGEETTRLTGKWTRADASGRTIELEFRADGTVSLNGEEAKYEIVDNAKLKIGRSFYFEEVLYEFNGSRSLTLKCDNTVWHDLAGTYSKAK